MCGPSLLRTAQRELLSMVQLCRQRKDAAQATRLIARLRQQDLESHSLLGNYIVPMLVDCGSLPDAQRVFDGIIPHHRNEHSWSSLITGYVDHGDPQHALHLYDAMQEAHVHGSNYTFLALLRACAVLKQGSRGQAIHAEITTEGLDGDAFLGNTLVDMYGKCRLLPEAHAVFHSLALPDSVSWNSLIAGYVDNGHGMDALSCFEAMQLDGVCPDDVTFVFSLKACTQLKDTIRGRELHTEIVAKGLEVDTYIGNTIVDMYGKCEALAEACKVFDSIPLRIASSWNALTATYAEHGYAEEALDCLKQMQVGGVSPVPTTFACSLKACSTTGGIEMGKELHADTIKRGMELEMYIGTTLVDMYAKFGLLAEAQDAFDRMPIRDTISWAALISQYADQGLDKQVLECIQKMLIEGVPADKTMFACSLRACGNIGALETGRELHAMIRKWGYERDLYVATTLVDMYSRCNALMEAQELFDRLQIRDAALWAALMSGYAEHGLDEEVLNCFLQMQAEGVCGQSHAFVCSLKACASLGALDTGREIHALVRKAGLEQDLFVGNMLVDMYGSCGSVAEACEVFNKMHVRDVVTWNAMIKGYGENDECDMASECFQDMQEHKVKPDAITFTCLLAICSRANQVAKGEEYFRLMREDYNIKPASDHYTCMVDLLARSGNVCKALGFVEAVDGLPSREILRALLTSCKLYGKVELGLRCFQQLVYFNQEDASAYLMMAEIYANAGRWYDAKSIEKMRKYTGADKKPASATLEIKKSVHEFVVGTNQSTDISEVLEFLSGRVKGEGHVPNLYVILRHEVDEDKEALCQE